MSPSANATGQLSSQQRILLALDDAVKKLETMEREKSEPIAIVGMGCRFPGGATDLDSYWQVLRNGVDAITPVPRDRWDADAYYDPDPAAAGKTYSRYGGFLEQIDQFDPQFFGISPREAQSVDPQQRLLLEVGWEALESSGWVPNQAVSKTGVFVGITTNDYARLITPMGDLDAIDAYYLTGNPLNAVAGRLAYTFGFRGPCMAVDTACSSSLVAVHLAVQSLRLGECDRALAGGVNLILTPENTVALSKAQMLSADGRCKTFDASADGIVRGEGCGVIVLKRLSDAVAGQDRILAVIRGSAVNQDGRSGGFTVPNKVAQQALLRQALTTAKVKPETVGYVEAHGTGTPLGDPIELRALGEVLGQNRPTDAPLRVGSVKTNFGHLESAAGIAGLIKVVLSLQHDILPPHLHFRDPNPHIDWQQLPIQIPTEVTPWPRANQPRLAGVSSFGASGTNAHVILEEAPAAENTLPTEPDRPLHILALSARSESALDDLVKQYRAYLTHSGTVPIADLCFSANTGRGQFDHRLCLLADSTDQLQAGLSTIASWENGGWRGNAETPPTVAFLFTGQGSQYIGMGRALYEQQPTFRRVLETCSALLEPDLGLSLVDLLYGDAADEATLSQTAFTQPALFALEYALAQLWFSWGVRPDVVMGHSVGEYVAACVAGVFSLEDGLKLIAARGRLMQALPAGGGMVSILAPEARVQAYIAPYGGEVAIAAVNDPTSLVISGAETALGAITEQLQQAGITFKPLTVSHAFHSALMEPMLTEFEQVLTTIAMRPPQLKLVSNLTGQVIGAEIATAAYWCRHVREPVQFAAGMAAVAALGCEVYLEVGPKPILLGMGRQCVTAAEQLWLPSLRPPQSDWQTMLAAVGQLYVRGAGIDWAGFDRDYLRQRLALPTYPFQRQRCWVETSTPGQPPGVNRLRATTASEHPLLGQRMQVATLAAPYFETRLDLSNPDYLADHQIYQQGIVPATAYIEMGLAAGKTVLHQGQLQLTAVSIQQPLSLAAGLSTPVQVVLQPTAAASDGSIPDSTYGFEVFSLKVGSRDGAESVWTRHAAGRVGPLPATEEVPAAVDLDELQAAYPETVAVADYYRRLWQRGMAYGLSFQGIQALWKGPEGVLGRVQLPAAIHTESDYCIHPALLDACFQVLGAVVEDGQTDAYLPVAIEAINLYGLVPDQVWSQVQLHPPERSKRRQISADLVLWNEAGEAIATLRGLTLKQVPQRVLQRVLQPSFDEWLYRLDWQPLPPATAPAGRPKRWLILSEPAEGIGVALADKLTREGDQCILVRAGKTYRQLGEAEFELNPTEPEQFKQLLDSTGAAGSLRYDGVVHLLGTTPSAALDSQALKQAQAMGCGSLLHLVQAVVQAQPTALPRLWIVTRATQAVAGIAATQPQFASLWGMGRVIATEHPDLHCTCLDLEQPVHGATQAPDVALLAAELRNQDASPQLAYRQQQRYGARLVRYRAAPLTAATNGLTVPDHPFQLRIREYGSLENLQLVPMQRRAPGPVEVEIAVRAVGLNFRDVLNALGMLKEVVEEMGITDTADLPFGGECAGVVTAVGDQVSHLQVGDAVIAAQTIGSLASHVIVPAAFIVPKPAVLSFEAAATIPTTFLTAYYGLHHLAQLQAGERVLIHAASGGVGQAAVQIARSLGADVWGSASEPKWAALKSQGLTQVFNSRTLDFVEQIPALTDGDGVDVVLNSLNGDFIPASLSVLGQRGRFVEIGKLGIWSDEQMTEARPDVTYLPFDLLDLSLATPELVTTLLQQVMTRFEQGQFAPLPHKIFPIQQGIEAFRYMAQTKHIGKVVISLPTIRPETNGHSRNDKGATASLVAANISPQATYLITGGLGALGLQVAQWLGQQGAKQLVLTGRRSPSSAAEDGIKRLQQAGVSVEVMATDVSQPAAVAELMAHIKSTLPTLKGIFHAAGMVDDAMVMGQTWERFETVMAPKVIGSWLLHEQTKDQDLDCFVCFSSVSALVGSPGQANYAAANAFMDALASYRQAMGLRALSINWGPWSQSGMAAALQNREQVRWASRGVGLIEPQQGLAILGQLLETAAPQVAVLPVDWERYLTQVPAGIDLSFLEQVATVALTEARPPQLWLDLQQTPAHKRRALLTQRLQGLLAKVMGLSPNQVNPQRGFADLGMDSLMAVEMRNLLQTDLGCAVPTTLAFDYPTVEALVDYFLEALEFEAAPAETPAATQVDGASVTESVLDRPGGAVAVSAIVEPVEDLDNLSAAELADLLAQELLTIREEKA